MGPESPPIILHIGYHKTATTWLQREYFPAHPDIRLPFKPPELAPILVQPHTFRFDADLARAALMERIEPIQHGTIVLSQERLSGHPASGGVDALEMADRLAATLPEAHIWIGIREQAAIIASNYSQFIKHGGTCSIEDFVAGDRPHKRIPYFTPDHFRFLPLIKYYETLFGQGRVHVMVYEEFRTDPDAVLDQIGSAAGFEHQPAAADAGRRNVSFSERSLRILRVANGLFVHPVAHHHFRPLIRFPGHYHLRRVLRFTDRIVGRGPRRLRARVGQILGNRFAASNRALGEHLGKDLARWGYVTGDE